MDEQTLSGKLFVVTGATSGIGYATAEQLVRQGASIIGVGRSPERCRAAEKRLEQLDPAALYQPNRFIHYLVADLALQSEIRALAGRIREIVTADGPGHLDGLINNAGAFTYWLALTPEGFETQWAVNHLAPFLLTNELLPLLQAAPSARVVTVSSDSHYGARLNWDDIQLRRHYNGLRAYGQTKLANILFTRQLNARLGQQSTVRAFAADPGLVKTEIGFKGTPGIVRWVWNLRRSGGIPPEESARGVVFLATAAGIQDSPEVYWKHSQPHRASRQALDAQAAGRLWDLSARMCGV